MTNLTNQCISLAPPGDDDLYLSTNNVTHGTVVSIACKKFGHRLVGPSPVKCLETGQWNDTAESVCKWTWELTTHEKVVLGTSIAAGAFIIVCIITILIAYCCCFRKRKTEEPKGFGSVYAEDRVKSPSNNYDPYGPPIVEGGPGIYPDAYYAYQEYPDKQYPTDVSDISGIDRPWLGYIPRPKVAEGRYYH
ncbi:uncharacterized protein LOC121373672 [Gigantopelta aegis]|uniref:uncharacterized protein LOC121373672 n=1 Tax=Gigantopelta aegis TaxID=1735272 RepID=UPI001B88CFED|nr:uncharacterized protein LOC121373672 [Gigantopelta aegis]